MIPHHLYRSLPLLPALAVAGVAATPGNASAQQMAVEDEVIQEIWEHAMEDSQIRSLAQTLMDSIGPRLTGSPSMDAAHDWAVETYEGWGIDARNEEYGTWVGWDRGLSHIDLIEPRRRSLEGMNLAWSPGTEGPVEGPVVQVPEVSDPEEFEAWLEDVEGAYVLVSFPEPTCRSDGNWEEYATSETFERMQEERNEARGAWQDRLEATGLSRDELHQALEDAGAAGIVTLNWSGGWGANRVFDSRTREIPTFELSCEDYGLVSRMAEKDQGPVLRVDLEAEFLDEVPVFNTVAEIPGTEQPDEYVMLSAHFDSWDGSSGATDNGTGTVLMMEVMRVLQEVLPDPKRTILVGHWGGEEQGLNGSRAFVEDHPDIVDGMQVLLNQDNGTGRIQNISMQGFTEAGSHFGPWLGQLPGEVAGHIDLSIPGMPSSGGTDHAAFVCAGAPAFNLSAVTWDYFTYTWHTNRDTFDKIVFDDLKNNVVVTASLAYLAAQDPERVSREKRERFPVSPQTGEEGEWPECQSPARSVDESGRMP